ncbi:MAG: POTRA domain-containing protein [Gammaproteobacteria bacterium]
MAVKKIFKLTPLAALLMIAQVSWAQPLGGFLPGSVLPEQVGKQLKREQVQTQEEVTAPSLSTPKPQETKLSAEAKKIKFKLNNIILVGNRHFSTEQLKPLYKDKLGKQISVADLFGIVQSITNYYRNNGYILSRAILPPQHVTGGNVRIQVVEGTIGRVTVTGDPKGARCLVQAIGEQIGKCPPLELSRMERYLLLENEIPGTQVKAVLEPSKSKTGAADISLVTQNKPITGYASYDDYGTRYIGPQQMTGNLGLNSMITSGDSTQFTFTKTPKGSELTYLDINYNMAIKDQGMRLIFGGTSVHTRPLYVLQPLKIDGLNSNYYINMQIPWIRTRSESLTWRINTNYLDSDVTADPLGLGEIPLYTDHLRSLGLGGTYNFADRYYGSNLLSADVRQGLPIFGYTSNFNPETAQTSRPGGRGTYTKIMATAARMQAIKGPWSAYGLVSGQYAFNPLLASEQFTFGGSQLGRGYDVAELIGDKGLAGSLELRYDLPVERFLVQSLQFYAFYDIGAVWNYLLIGDTPIKSSGASTGLGVRFFATKYVSGNLMWTQVLTRSIAALEQPTVDNMDQGRTPRVFFSIVASLQ